LPRPRSTEAAEGDGRAGTFEPLRAGDRQKQKRMPKPRNLVKSVRFEVSLS
jgi:hypothetical protein